MATAIRPGFKITTVLILFIFAALALPFTPAEAATYSTGFKTDTIEITTPNTDGMTTTGLMTVAGKSSLDEVWFCVRGPGGELATYPGPVTDGAFSVDIWLRFGAGTYTVWAGDNPTRFDGKIRFLVENSEAKDTRTVAPSAWVDSDNPEVKLLAESLVSRSANELDKLRAIHGWVTRNVAYDYSIYQSGENRMATASETIIMGNGICRDYAFVVAALARAAGLEAKVVYGQVAGTDGWEPQLHAWNEVLADGRWVSLDATWDAGYIRDNQFVAAPSTKYFDPDAKVFAKTHQVSSYTLH